MAMRTDKGFLISGSFLDNVWENGEVSFFGR